MVSHAGWRSCIGALVAAALHEELAFATEVLHVADQSVPIVRRSRSEDHIALEIRPHGDFRRDVSDTHPPEVLHEGSVHSPPAVPKTVKIPKPTAEKTSAAVTTTLAIAPVAASNSYVSPGVSQKAAVAPGPSVDPASDFKLAALLTPRPTPAPGTKLKPWEVIKGPPGPSGLQGILGIRGEKGNTGPKGKKGAEGKQGPIGIAGKLGWKGKKGVQGQRGKTGAIGDPGSIATRFDSTPYVQDEIFKRGCCFAMASSVVFYIVGYLCFFSGQKKKRWESAHGDDGDAKGDQGEEESWDHGEEEAYAEEMHAEGAVAEETQAEDVAGGPRN